MQIIGRITSVLEQISRKEELPLGEIAGAVGLKKTTAANILKALCSAGLLKKSESGKYSIGKTLVSLARSSLEGDTITGLAQDYAGALCAEIGEAVVVSILRQGARYLIANVSPSRMLQADVSEEKRPFLYETATGRVLLAYSCADELRLAIEKNGFPEMRWDGINNIRNFNQVLRRLRLKKYELAESPVHEVVQLAVPVFYQNGMIAAAVGVRMPVTRWRKEKNNILEKLLKTAEHFEAALRIKNISGPEIKHENHKKSSLTNHCPL